MAKKPGTDQLQCCTVCLEEYKRPRLLPCNHTYCEPCLEGIIEKSECKSSLMCPQCRAQHQVPSGGPKAFLIDLTITQDIETKKWHKKMTTKQSICGVCEHNMKVVTDSYCPQCEAFLCSYCTGAHKRMKVFSSHEIVPAVKFKAFKPKPKPVNCSLHPTYRVSFYCNTCNQLICNKCVAGPGSSGSASFTASNNHHSGHKLYTLTIDSVESIEAQLDQAVKKTKSRKLKVQIELRDLQEVESKREKHTKDLKKALSDSVESYIKALRIKCSEELAHIDEESANTSEAIQEHKKALRKKIAEFDSGLHFAQKAKDCDDKVHKIAMMGQAMVIPSLKEYTSMGIGRSRSFFPASEISSSTVTAGEQQKNLPSLAQLHEPPLVVRNLECTLKSKGLLQKYSGINMHCQLMSGFHCTLGQESKFSVTFSVQPIGQPEFRIVYGGSNFSKELPFSSAVNNSSTNTSWILTLTPCCNGTHKVHVKIYGRWVTENAPTFDVTGELKEGDLVQRTPNSEFTITDLFEDGEDKDLSDYEVGKLTKVGRSFLGKSYTSNYEVEVTWGHDSEEPIVEELTFIWSEYSGFPIELAIVPTSA